MKKIKYFIVVFLMALLLFPAVKTQAATLATPDGISLEGQKSSTFQISWNYDQSLSSYTTAGYTVGYEVVLSSLKGKEIITYNTQTADTDTMGLLVDEPTKMAVNATKGALKSKPFVVKVRSFMYDQTGEYTYSEYSEEKIIVPRATIKKKAKAVGSNAGKISWSKVSGAKSYTVYMSSNSGKKFKKVTTTKSTSAIIRGLKKNVEYYFYVQANKVKCNKKRMNSTKPTRKVSNCRIFYLYTSY